MLSAVLVAEIVIGAALIAVRPGALLDSPRSQTTVSIGGREVALVDLGGDRTEDLLARVRTDIPAAIDSVVRFWGPEWPSDIVVVATGSDEQFARQGRLDPAKRWSDIAAVSVADSVDPGARRVEGQRIVFGPGASAMSDSALRIVLAHELFHVAARADTATDAPRWLTEGVADFVARPPAPLPPDAATDDALPTDAELDVAGPQRSAGYDRAWWFARFVADTYGADGLRRLYMAACRPGHAGFPEAVREALGTDLGALQARWSLWLSRQASQTG